MAESKEIALRKSDIASFIDITSSVPGEPVYEGLMAIYNYVTAYADGNEEVARKGAYENRFSIGDLWRRLKELEKFVKQCKPVVESIASDVPFPDVFKWQAGSVKTKKDVTDTVELWKRMEQKGVSIETFLSNCKIDYKDAVELAGLSEKVFLEEFAGDVVNIEQTQTKPVLKAL